jgi:hypothetical protein
MESAEHVGQLLKGLEFFKDWSNYLLVTTVAALGWVTTSQHLTISRASRRFVIASLAVSVVFAIFTLALVPLVAEAIVKTTTSIYDVTATFRVFWLWGPEFRLPLKAVCWPQHISFILAIVVYAAATAKAAKPSR